MTTTTTTLDQATEIIGTYREGVRFIEVDEDNNAYYEVKGSGNWANPIYKIDLDRMENFNRVRFESKTVFIQVDDDDDENPRYLVQISTRTFDENLEALDYDYKVLKTYKRESSAMKFGKKFAEDEKASFDGLVFD